MQSVDVLNCNTRNDENDIFFVDVVEKNMWRESPCRNVCNVI